MNIDNSWKSCIYLLRGPPGTGKSTIAKRLCEDLRSKNIPTAYFEQDYFRGGILGNFGAPSNLYGPILLGAIKGAISSGCTVIIEGMFTLPKNAELIEDISKLQNAQVIYLQNSVEVSLSRHASREKSATVSAEEIAKWYKLCTPSNVQNEHIIENTDVQNTLQILLDLNR